jgi:type IV pilus assembly protein PilA
VLSSAIECLRKRRHAAVVAGMGSGFSLIELMVVLLILAILLAIAIPTFLGVSAAANDQAARSNLNTGLTAAKTWSAQHKQSYTGATAVLLHSNEPSIIFGDSTNQTTEGPVSDYVSVSGNGIVLASYSLNNKTCWYTVDNLTTVAAGAGGAYGAIQSLTGSATQAPSAAGTWYSSNSGAATCNAGIAPTAAAAWTN